MSLETILERFGVSQVDANMLAEHSSFHHKNKNDEELTNVFKKIASVYDCSLGEVIAAVLKFPPFASYNHSRVVSEASAVYGNEDAVKEAVLKFPPFASYDHSRVVRERLRLGRLAGLSKNETIDLLLKKPVLASYSARRYLAGFDIARALQREGFPYNKTMRDAYFSYISKSPYVPGSQRQRISKVPDSPQEPPLMTAMRRYLERNTV